MRIGIIGGAERTEPQLKRLASAAGHEVEFHAGHMSSCGAASLEALITRCDLLVITTDVNSHAAVRAARGLSRARGITPMMCRRLGVGRFSELLTGLKSSALGIGA
ncbi:MAG: DUF2325 domain-containing protein [Myxococcales bacterium]